MNKPASKAFINNLSTNMGNVIQECFPSLINNISVLSNLYEKLKTKEIDGEISNHTINILELHTSVLYVIIEIACSFRADFRSDNNIEKRINLKYLVFITSEFYKATFLSNNSLWIKVSTFLRSLNETGLNDSINIIGNNLAVYKNQYFDKDKDNRDVSIHYDFDLETLYKYLTEINEETEAQRVCTFLSIVQPLNNLLTKFLALPTEGTLCQERFTFRETNTEQQLFETLKKNIYPELGIKIQNFATYIDKDMITYILPDNLPENLSSMIGKDGIDKIKGMRDYAKLVIILHYVYLDLGTALIGFLSSESFIEKQLNLIRLNLIIYEGYKKIYVPQNENTESLWEQYIYTPLSLHGQDCIKKDLNYVRSELEIYKNDKQIEKIRHKYIHLRKHNKFNLPDLLDILFKLKSYDELNKSLAFLKLLNRIIELSNNAMNVASEIDSSNTHQVIMQQFNQIKSQISGSNISNENKEEILKTINNEMNKIINRICHD